MKIRNGFVSNSSSSSFICDVCGTSESGWDMSVSDSGMFMCENGHCCCESHQINIDPSPEEKRTRLVRSIEQSPYYKNRPSEAVEELKMIAKMSDNDVGDKYDDITSDAGLDVECCPICMFKKLDTKVALQYLLKMAGKTEEELLAELKVKFSNFLEFRKYSVGK